LGSIIGGLCSFRGRPETEQISRDWAQCENGSLRASSLSGDRHTGQALFFRPSDSW